MKASGERSQLEASGPSNKKLNSRREGRGGVKQERRTEKAEGDGEKQQTGGKVGDVSLEKKKPSLEAFFPAEEHRGWPRRSGLSRQIQI